MLYSAWHPPDVPWVPPPQQGAEAILEALRFLVDSLAELSSLAVDLRHPANASAKQKLTRQQLGAADCEDRVTRCVQVLGEAACWRQQSSVTANLSQDR